MTALLLAFAVPAVLMIPVTGRIVDRYDSRRPEPGEHEESGGMLEGFRVVFTDGLLRVLVPGLWVFIIAAEASRTRAMPAAFAVIGLASAAMGEARTVVQLFVAGAAGGMAGGLLNAAAGALLMTRTVDAVRGRVLAALTGSGRAFSIVALVLGGLAGSALGARATFVVTGGSSVLAAVVLAAALRSRLRRVVPDVSPAAKDSVQAVPTH